MTRPTVDTRVWNHLYVAFHDYHWRYNQPDYTDEINGNSSRPTTPKREHRRIRCIILIECHQRTYIKALKSNRPSAV